MSPEPYLSRNPRSFVLSPAISLEIPGVFILVLFLKIVGVFGFFPPSPGASAVAGASRRRTSRMAGKGGKGLIAAKTAAGMYKEKKQPVTRSLRAGLQVAPLFLARLVASSRPLRD